MSCNLQMCLPVLLWWWSFPYTYSTCSFSQFPIIDCAVFVCYNTFEMHIQMYFESYTVLGFELLCPCGVGHTHTAQICWEQLPILSHSCVCELKLQSCCLSHVKIIVSVLSVLSEAAGNTSGNTSLCVSH